MDHVYGLTALTTPLKLLMRTTLVLTTAAVLPLVSIPFAQAVTYTYTGISGSEDWSTGASWDATPVSASDTILTFDGTISENDSVTSNNDVADPFTLNRMNINYEGGNTTTFNLTGGALNFVNNGGTTPVISIRPSSGPVINIANDLTLSDQVNITSNNTSVNINGQISGSGLLNLIGNNGDSATFTLTNTANDWTGGLRISTVSTTGGTRAVVLGASEVLPNGAGAGDIFIDSDGEGTHTSLLQLNGFNETVNGIQAVYQGNMRNKDQNQRINNGGDTNAVLTVGDNNTSSNFLGLIENGDGLGNLGINKTGAGDLTLAARSTYTGATNVEQGSLTIDYTQFGKTQTSDPADYFTTDSDVTLSGGTTIAIKGREDGGEVVNDSIGTQQYGNYITVSSSAVADQIVVGQELLVTRPDESVDTYFVTGKIGNDIYTETRTGGGSATLNTNATVATTTQNIKSITLAGANGENATVDLGTSDNVSLIFNASPVQLNDGSTITFSNWSGSFSGGGDDQILFAGDPSEFSSVLSQSEVIFDGFGAGYNLIDFGGTYEVVAVPEPTTYALLFASGALLYALRRRRLN